MALTNGIPKSYNEAVRVLASWHAEGLSEKPAVFVIPDPDEQVVRLIEVSGAFPASGDAWPVVFGRSKDFPFPSSVIQVTPGEWDQIQKGQIRLPEGWDLTSRQTVDFDD